MAVLRFDGAPAHFREFRRGAPARLSIVPSQICQALDPAGGLGVAGTYCLNGRPSIPLFFNEQTGRWDVVWKHPDGTESVVGAYSTLAESMEHVSLANNEPAGPPS
jgi:hypothetical protein